MNKEVIMTALDTLTAGRTDDQTLELIEAITNELNTADEGGENSTAELDALRAEYEAKLAACDETWRNKYRTAFFHGAEQEEPEEEEEEEKEEMTDYDALFKKGNAYVWPDKSHRQHSMHPALTLSM